MAIYRLSVKHGTVQNKGKAAKHCDYIHAKNDYEYKVKEIAYEREFMPEWVNSSTEFFKLSEEKERVNGQTYKEFEIALINDIPLEENIKLLNDFLEKELQNKHYFTAVIHNKETSKKGSDVTVKNIHAHIMFCTRELDGVKRDENTFFKRANKKYKERGGALKNEKWNSTNLSALYKIRKSYEEELNNVLEKHNMEKVSCESLASQRQTALLNNDIDTYNRLNRKPLNCDIRILNKVRKNLPLTKKEKTVYQEYTKTLKEKNILDEIYYIEIQRQKLVKEQQNILDTEEKREELDKQNYSYSYDYMKDKFKNIIEAEKYLMQANINIEKINIEKINLREAAIFTLYPEYKVLVDEQQFYLDKIATELTEENYNEFVSKLAECESKLNNISIDETLVEKEKENINAKLIHEELSIKSDISYLNKNKNTFYKDFDTNDKDTFSDILLEQHFYNNMNSLVSNMFQLEQRKKGIEKIDKQLNKGKLQEIAINIITKSKSRKITNEIKKCTNQKNSIEDLLKITRFSEKELLQKQEELSSLNAKIQNLTSKYNELMKSLEVSEVQSKIINISSNIEKKLLNKRNSLLSDRKLIKQNILLYRTQAFDTVKNKEQLINLRKHYRTNAAIHEKNLEKYNSVLQNLRTLQKNNNLEQLAYNKITNGRFYKLLSEYNTKKSALEKDKNDLKELGFFKVKEKKMLSDNIEILKKDCELLQQEYLTITQSISSENLNEVAEEIKQVYINAEKNIKEKIQDESNSKFENTMKAKYINEIKNELYKFVPEVYLDTVSMAYVDPENFGLDDEGYSSDALGTGHNKKKRKNRDKELSL